MVRAKVNQVKLVTTLTWLTALKAFMAMDTRNAATPNPTNLRQGSRHTMEARAWSVPQTFKAMATMGVSMSTEVTVLIAGIQAGNGAVSGMPVQGPNKSKPQKAKSAR